MPVSPRIALGLRCRRADRNCRATKPIRGSSGRSFSPTARPTTTVRARFSRPSPCKSESEILAAIGQVHAKYDQFEGVSLAAFEERATLLKGFPPLNIEKLYVITEDDQLRDGDIVLFIGLIRVA